MPVITLFISTLTMRNVRPLRWWAGALLVLYLLQIFYIVAGEGMDSGFLRAMHPFNGGLLLMAAFVIVAKTERSHRRRRHLDN